MKLKCWELSQVHAAKRDHTSKLGILMRMKVTVNGALWFNKKIAKG
jgi:hypothetical protein